MFPSCLRVLAELREQFSFLKRISLLLVQSSYKLSLPPRNKLKPRNWELRTVQRCPCLRCVAPAPWECRLRCRTSPSTRKSREGGLCTPDILEIKYSSYSWQISKQLLYVAIGLHLHASEHSNILRESSPDLTWPRRIPCLLRRRKRELGCLYPRVTCHRLMMVIWLTILI